LLENNYVFAGRRLWLLYPFYLLTTFLTVLKLF